MLEFLIGSLALFAIWLIIFIFYPATRREMSWASFITMPLGLTEIFFVPAYWNPPTLFNLAQKFGFDIESFIFAFAVGGIVSVIYEILLKSKHKSIFHEHKLKKHRYHKLALLSPFLTFAILIFVTKLNPIYSASLSLAVGALATYLCRKDLDKNIIFGGILFLSLYFIFFLMFNLIFPGYVDSVWNFSEISGIKIIGVPIEELMFAFTFGVFWSSFYEHVKWYKLKV